jgi:aryl-alcohol dehydrogenase-like predicted oxidoreductase
MLPKRKLGQTGMEITTLGLGAWAIGGGEWFAGWGDQDDADSIEAIHAAIESGINWIDTAAVYGLGHSEKVVGKALKDFSDNDRPLVFTKCGRVGDPTKPKEQPKSIGRKDSIEAEVDASLRNLGVEQIDLMQVHWPSEDVPLEEEWQTLVDLKNKGKIRAIGLSNHNPELLDRAEKIHHVETLQPHFSVITRKAGASELPWCQSHNTGVIVYSPMENGILTGAFSADRVANLPENDWRRRSPKFTTNLAANLALTEKLSVIAQRRGVSTAAIALGWVLAWPMISGAIVGARNGSQIAGWIDGANTVLSDDELDEIAKAIDETGAGEGPNKPNK